MSWIPFRPTTIADKMKTKVKSPKFEMFSGQSIRRHRANQPNKLLQEESNVNHADNKKQIAENSAPCWKINSILGQNCLARKAQCKKTR